MRKEYKLDLPLKINRIWKEEKNDGGKEYEEKGKEYGQEHGDKNI